MSDVWILRNFVDKSQKIFGSEGEALSEVYRLVGNTSGGHVGACVLYGPGDGTTTIAVDKCSREDAAFLFPKLKLPGETSEVTP